MMGQGLTGDEAKQIREALIEANVFGGIQIEVDTDSGSVFPDPAGP